MDTDTVICAPDVEMTNKKGVHGDNAYERDEAIEAEMVNGDLDLLQISDANASTEVLCGSENCDMTNPSVEVMNSEECMQANGLADHVEGEVQETHQETKSKKQVSQGKSKTGKLLTSKTAGAAGLNKSNSGKELKVTSNGTRSVISRPKKPSLTSTKSFNDGPIVTGHAKKVTPIVAASNTKTTMQPAKNQSMPSTDNEGQSDAMDKTNLRPLRKEAEHKIKGDEESTISPTSGEAKSCRAGKLPAYSFSFRCNERAEKRREFYSKLEEKIHAKEVEVINQEAKSKESQEAEIRKLRKSLNFKATPMPNFYQEPPPPKVELKKQPTTRPKSPKLGRRKSSSPADAEAGVSHNHSKGRLSLGERFSHDKQTKPSSPAHTPKPQRKSLPKLPSQKTTLLKTTPKASPSIKDLSNDAVPPLPSTSTPLEQVSGATEIAQTENVTEIEPVVELENGQAMGPVEPVVELEKTDLQCGFFSLKGANMSIQVHKV